VWPEGAWSHGQGSSSGGGGSSRAAGSSGGGGGSAAARPTGSPLPPPRPHPQVEIINGLPEDATISLYRCGPMVDLCHGPHLPNTNLIKVRAGGGQGAGAAGRGHRLDAACRGAGCAAGGAEGGRCRGERGSRAAGAAGAACEFAAAPGPARPRLPPRLSR
jgi:hypothetical protein